MNGQKLHFMETWHAGHVNDPSLNMEQTMLTKGMLIIFIRSFVIGGLSIHDI